jgi:hypothetical protein
MNKAEAGPDTRSVSDNGLFALLVAMFIGHELDAMAQHEWRLLYVLRDLPDSLGQDVFILLHVPIILVLVWLGWHSAERTRSVTRVGCAVFMVVHAGLHWRLREDPIYTFHSATSMFLIFGSLIPAVLLLVLYLWRGRKRVATLDA